MNIASLFHTTSNEDYALAACSDHGIEVSRFRDISTALASLRSQRRDGLVIEDADDELSHWLAALQLSIGMPMPIVVFGAGGADRIAGALQCGAEDYSTHAEGPAALMQRLLARMQLRRERSKAQRLKVGGCTLDAGLRSLRHLDHEVGLTTREFALAWALFEQAGRVVTYDTLSVGIWGRSSDIGKRTIEQHVYRLRRKITSAAGDAADQPSIEAVYGVGYRLLPGGEPQA